MTGPVLSAPVLFVDRVGDVWRSAGFDAKGAERLVCDEPQSPDDQVIGASFPWARSAVESWFGPLVRTEAPRVVEGSALVLADGTVLVREVSA